MTQKLEIRQADVSDEAAVRACAEDAYKQYVVVIGRKPAPMVADFNALIASGFVYVATDEQSEILGFIVFYAKGDQVLLENVAVKTQATGRRHHVWVQTVWPHRAVEQAGIQRQTEGFLCVRSSMWGAIVFSQISIHEINESVLERVGFNIMPRIHQNSVNHSNPRA